MCVPRLWYSVTIIEKQFGYWLGLYRKPRAGCEYLILVRIGRLRSEILFLW